jgi:hypothetical protein
MRWGHSDSRYPPYILRLDSDSAQARLRPTGQVEAALFRSKDRNGNCSCRASDVGLPVIVGSVFTVGSFPGEDLSHTPPNTVLDSVKLERRLPL